MATLLVVSSVIQLAGLSLTADALAGLVPHWMLVGLAIAYGLGGVLLLLGMAWHRQDIEAAGCVLVGNGIAVRLLALIWVLGSSIPVLATATFYIVFGWACLARFVQILRHERIVRVSQHYVLHGGPEQDNMAITHEDSDA